MHGKQAQRNFKLSDADVRGHAPSPLAFKLKPEDQQGQRVEGKTPDHAKCVGFTQDIDVASAGDDGEQLQANHQIDNAIAGPKLFVGPAKPVGKNAILGNAVEHPVRPDDRGIDRA